MNHLIQEKLISSKQHDFVNFRSTVTQLLNYLDRATETIGKEKVVDVIYFNFAKAFDTVPHSYGIKNDRDSGLDTIIPHRSKSSSESEWSEIREAQSIEWRTTGKRYCPLLFVLYCTVHQ